MPQERKYPPDFRQDVLTKVFYALALGESCSLIGVGSTGKSNVARHMVSPQTLKHYLGDQAADCTLASYVNCGKLVEYEARSLYCLLLEALLALPPNANPQVSALVPQWTAMWEQATATESSDRARRALEDAIRLALQSGIQQVYLVLDDFDPVVVKMPGPALNSLRALRDDFKARLMYVTLTRRELHYLRNESEYQDLYELVTSHPVAVGPYSPADALWMINWLTYEWPANIRPGDKERERIIDLSGGHPGLIRAILGACQDQTVDLERADAVLRLRGKAKPENEKIWESLEDGERNNLIKLESRQETTIGWLNKLILKGLVEKRALDEQYRVVSPLFADFVRGNRSVGRFPISCTDNQEVNLDGRVIPIADRVAFEVFSFLLQRRGHPVSRADLVQELGRLEQVQPTQPRWLERRLGAILDSLQKDLNTPGCEVLICKSWSVRVIGLDGM